MGEVGVPEQIAFFGLGEGLSQGMLSERELLWGLDDLVFVLQFAKELFALVVVGDDQRNALEVLKRRELLFELPEIRQTDISAALAVGKVTLVAGLAKRKVFDKKHVIAVKGRGAAV